MTTTTSRTRPVVAAVVAAVVLAVCAVPLFWTAAFSVAAFTGCFLECTEPEPAVGVLWGSLALLLGTAPAAAGALAGGYRVGAAVVPTGLGLVGLAVLVLSVL